jgi:CDP-glucose 4,6-dehydratase
VENLGIKNTYMLASHSSFWPGRKVLLTGHTGFKGSWLARWLLDLGADVTGLALSPSANPNLFTQLGLAQDLNHNILDISCLSDVKDLVHDSQPEFVFHLAAQPLVHRSYEDPLQTWQINVGGTINILEALRLLEKPCSAVMVTTDKVYQNNEWNYGYRECDPLGGHDPYSSSKAAAEIAIASWRASFCGSLPHQTPYLRIASARAGNVIGGGDWSINRIVPDAIRSLKRNADICLRNPSATRPWQHVLEPLDGYLSLAQALYHSGLFARAYNFGPTLNSNRTVVDLVTAILTHWPGRWTDSSDLTAPHEAGMLNLVIDRAYHELGWSPRWDFPTTVERTVNWYKRVEQQNASALECCRDDIAAYQAASLP